MLENIQSMKIINVEQKLDDKLVEKSSENIDGNEKRNDSLQLKKCMQLL